jgi:hypothetical protein
MEAKAPRERSNRMSSARQLNDIARGDRKARGSRIFFGFFEGIREGSIGENGQGLTNLGAMFLKRVRPETFIVDVGSHGSP